MKRVMGFFLVATLVLGVSVIANANTPRINKREHYQQERIREGIRSGALTRHEAARLEAEQAKIRVDEARARADGHVSYRERERLTRELSRASRDIHHQKHDQQHRGR